MIKIEKIVGIDGVSRSLSDLEKLYTDLINKKSTNFVHPKDELKSFLNDYNLGSFEYEFTEKLIELLDNFLLTAKPIELEEFIQDINGDFSKIYDGEKLTPFGKKIESAFKYKYYREKRLVEFSQYLNIKTCPYCNCQYTLTIGKNELQRKAKFQFDHFFPKKVYPFFSISMYNLIPSCANCNLSKSKNVYTLGELVNPYHESFHSLTKFEIDKESEKDLLLNSHFKGRKVKVHLTKKDVDVRVKNYNEEFHLEQIYERHNDIVEEIYLKAKAYNITKKNELLSWTTEGGIKIFPDEATLNRILLGNFPDDKEINKRPLAKFTLDIARQAGLIK